MTILNMTYGQGNPYQPFHLNAISDLSITWWDTEATITWSDPWNLVVDGQTLATWVSTKLVRKVGSAPSNSSDWTLVVEETVADTYSSTGYTDTGLTNGTTYYYWAFAVADNGTEIISNIESVTPDNKWQPWANTLVYRPVDWDMKDYSWNWYDLQWSPTSYETLSSWLKVWVFDWNVNPRPWNIYPNTAPILQVTQHNTNNFTVSFWINVVTFTTETWIMYVQWTGSYQAFYWLVNNTNTFRFWLGNWAWSDFAFKDFNTTNSANTWYHIVFVYDYNSWSPYVKCYKDNVLLDTINTNAFNNWNAWDCWTIMYSHYDNSCKKISRWIIEDKVRTAQEVSDYFDSTKADYWIS